MFTAHKLIDSIILVKHYFSSLHVRYYINFFHRKSRIDTGKKSKTMTVDSEDENSEKENVSSNDNDDVFK